MHTKVKELNHYFTTYRYLDMDTNAHTFMQICMQIVVPPPAGTVRCTFIPFVKKKWIFKLCCELQCGGSRAARLAPPFPAKQILLIFFGSRRSPTIVQTSWISNHLPGQRRGWRSTSPRTCAAYRREMPFLAFFFFLGVDIPHHSRAAAPPFVR